VALHSAGHVHASIVGRVAADQPARQSIIDMTGVLGEAAAQAGRN